jgi:hypothetical protein
MSLGIDDYIYGSSGDSGATFFTAINVRTGVIAWQTRFPRASFLWVDGRVLSLSENGELSLATLSPAGMAVHCKTLALTPRAWTVPTLVGRTRYLRDRQLLMALELG